MPGGGHLKSQEGGRKAAQKVGPAADGDLASWRVADLRIGDGLGKPLSQPLQRGHSHRWAPPATPRRETGWIRRGREVGAPHPSRSHHRCRMEGEDCRPPPSPRIFGTAVGLVPLHTFSLAASNVHKRRIPDSRGGGSMFLVWSFGRMLAIFASIFPSPLKLALAIWPLCLWQCVGLRFQAMLRGPFVFSGGWIALSVSHRPLPNSHQPTLLGHALRESVFRFAPQPIQ